VLYRILRAIAWFLCKALFRLKVSGRCNIPKEGGAIIAANHSSYIDPVAIAVAVPRRISWIVRKDVYDVWWLKGLFASTGMIREGGSVEKAVKLLEQGGLVGIFPEGTRSPDGKLGAGRRGASVMALTAGVPVIPCGITGAFEAYPRGAVFPKSSPVKVSIGKPIAGTSPEVIMDAIDKEMGR